MEIELNEVRRVKKRTKGDVEVEDQRSKERRVKERLHELASLYVQNHKVVEETFAELKLEDILPTGLTWTSLTCISFSLTWTLEDWVQFIPYINKIEYLRTAPLYKQTLKRLLDAQEKLASHTRIQWTREALKAWSASPTPVDPLDAPATQEEEERKHFYMDIFSGRSLPPQETCVYCLVGNRCALKGAGKCSPTFLCMPLFGLHLCRKHSNDVNKLDNCELGLADRFQLTDGRVIPHLGHVAVLSMQNVAIPKHLSLYRPHSQQPTHLNTIQEEDEDRYELTQQEDQEEEEYEEEEDE